MLLVSSFAFIATSGCAVTTIPPPAPPAHVEPVLDGPPKEAPAAPNGRVILDAEGESAWVSRVTETGTLYGPGAPYAAQQMSQNGLQAAPLLRREELLCVTPCAVDLRQGAHQFVFKSRVDPHRLSTADVVVTSQPVFVRHALGREAHMTGTYVGGATLLLSGIGLTILGGSLAGLGALLPERADDGRPINSDGIVTAGLITLGLGVITGTIGGLLMGYHRPAEQSGATTQWRSP